MENEVFKSDEFRKRMYLSEFEFFDGEYFIKFIATTIKRTTAIILFIVFIVCFLSFDNNLLYLLLSCPRNP